VYLNGYYIDKYEVTWARYAAYLNEALSLGTISATSTTVTQNGKELIPLDEYWCYIEYVDAEFTVKGGYEDYPAEYISWYGAEAYAEHYYKRLPTEAEWEKAARGTDGWIYPWGNERPNPRYLNFNNQVGDTTPAGFYPPGASPYGAFDMAGNVAEWAADWYSEDTYASSEGRNPSGPETGEYRVLRGGSWFNPPRAVRTTFRLWNLAGLGFETGGFRCARSE
jgi:formylglycine-generating enzyme required for sulfatase activity